MVKKPCDDCQKSDRLACSEVRYQAPVMRRNPGEMLHSKKPWRARRAMSWDQLLHALMQRRQTAEVKELEGVVDVGRFVFVGEAVETYTNRPCRL